MNAFSFPPNPAFGQFYQNWVWNGSRWVCTSTPGTRIITTVFTASGPYMPSPGLISLVVETIGGGGGGGGITGFSPSPELWIQAGGGGGSGGYSRMTLAAALVLGGVNVTIGAGGVEGLPTAPGGPGAATSFGALCIANGGFGGASFNPDGPGGYGAPGQGAPVGVGDVAFPGQPGGAGQATGYASPTTIDFSGGTGGAIFGGSVATIAGYASFNDGANGMPNTGAGGTGACGNQVGPPPVTQGGGAGGSGICIVTEYCWADAIDSGCGCGPTSGQARIQAPGWQGGYGYDND
jgi:hypothetical protein